jgi:hypothetical protein
MMKLTCDPCLPLPAVEHRRCLRIRTSHAQVIPRNTRARRRRRSQPPSVGRLESLIPPTMVHVKNEPLFRIGYCALVACTYRLLYLEVDNHHFPVSRQWRHRIDEMYYMVLARLRRCFLHCQGLAPCSMREDDRSESDRYATRQ